MRGWMRRDETELDGDAMDADEGLDDSKKRNSAFMWFSKLSTCRSSDSSDKMAVDFCFINSLSYQRIPGF